MISPLLLMHHKNVSSGGNPSYEYNDPVGTVYNFSYTGAEQSINLGPGTYKLEVWGAEGGYRSSASYSGKGGYSVGTITLTNESTKVYAYAGGSGRSGVKSGNIYAGGFNGGGYRYGYYGGGGGSDFRIGSNSLYARVIVAGGGGSDGATSKKGMYGGGTTGGSSTESYTAGSNYCGKGGTATYSGYSASYTIATQATTGLNSNSTSYYCGGFGFGGGGVYLSSGYGGAGGGGWYGGSGTVPDGSGDDDRGGGGGSGYVYTSSTYSNYPSGCLLNSSYYLTSASTTAGNASFKSPTGSNETGHSGNGHCRITVVSGSGRYYPKVKSCRYVEGDGTDYIQTDIYPSNTNAYTVSYKIQINESGVTKAYFGGRTNSSKTASVALFQVSGVIREDWGTTETTSNITVESGSTYTGTFGGLNSTSFTSTGPLSIFNVNTAGSINSSYYGIGKIYYIKFFDSSGNLTMHLVPCKYDGNKGCLYDKIGKKIYLSNGGKITAG